MTRRSKARPSPLMVLGAVLALAFPFVLVGIAVVQSCEHIRDPQTLEDWIEELGSGDHKRIEAAVEELAERGREDPERVVPALIDAMHDEMHDKWLATGLREIEHPVRLLVSLEDHDPFDPRHVMIEADGEPLYLLVPRLPIGMWIFGSSIETFTLPKGPLAKEFQVQKEVQDAFLAFTTRHQGRKLAFVSGNDVLWLHDVEEPVGDVIRLVAPVDDKQAVANLRRITSFPTLSFHDGYTEAGRALALVGEVVIEPLEAAARMDDVTARAAAWARWRLDENLR